LEDGRKGRQGLLNSASTLYEKNLALIQAAFEIFDLKRGWDKVKTKITGAQVKEFYAFIAALWPPSTELIDLLPEADSTLRALYLGEYEPELLVQNVFRFCLYTDQIVLVNPFENPNIIAEQHNPIVHPDEWKLETLRTVFYLMLIAPWIEKGFVILIPSPGDFDVELRNRTFESAFGRLKANPITQADIDASFMKQKVRRLFASAPPEYLDRMAREANPGISDALVAKLLQGFEDERLSDPFLTGQTMDQMPAQYIATRSGANLEMGMYLSQMMGAFPYTNIKFRWREILSAKQQFDANMEVWTPLTNAFQQLPFKFLDKVDPKFAYAIREDGRLEGFRGFLRKVWQTVGGQPDQAKAGALARDFRDELTQAHNTAEAEWDKIDIDLLKWGGPIVSGGLATGLFSPSLPAAGFAIAAVLKLLETQKKRSNFRKTVPMSVFIDLKNK
jgi:hypothetical protein